MLQFLKQLIYNAFGPLTRCKPNVHQKAIVLIFLIYAQKGQFRKNKNKIKNDYSLVFFFFFFPFPPKEFIKYLL